MKRAPVKAAFIHRPRFVFDSAALTSFVIERRGVFVLIVGQVRVAQRMVAVPSRLVNLVSVSLSLVDGHTSVMGRKIRLDPFHQKKKE